jgi:hypothetical protein
MLSATWALVAFMTGVLALILLAVVGQIVAVDLRKRLVNPYFKWAETVMGPSAIVWRRLGRPTLKPIAIDDEREVAEVTQSSGVLSDDVKLPFRDEADAKAPLFKHQLTVVPEGVPAAVDAELAELAHWFDQHAKRSGLRNGDQFDPFVPLPDKARSVNPLDVTAALDVDVTPEDAKTVERHTEARFEKYGGMPSAKEAGAMLVTFGVGAGVVMFAVYLRQEVLGGGGGGAPEGGTVPIWITDMSDMMLDVVMVSV